MRRPPVVYSHLSSQGGEAGGAFRRARNTCHSVFPVLGYPHQSRLFSFFST